MDLTSGGTLTVFSLCSIAGLLCLCCFKKKQKTPPVEPQFSTETEETSTPTLTAEESSTKPNPKDRKKKKPRNDPDYKTMAGIKSTEVLGPPDKEKVNVKKEQEGRVVAPTDPQYLTLANIKSDVFVTDEVKPGRNFEDSKDTSPTNLKEKKAILRAQLGYIFEPLDMKIPPPPGHKPDGSFKADWHFPIAA